MREIEIKVSVRDKTSLRSKLDELSIKLGKPKKQHDVVYGIKQDREFERQASWLRIRTENDKTIYFTLKKNVTSELDSIEHEIIVDDAETLEKIIITLGFELYSDLTKTRQEVAYGDIEICYDEVPELGTFIEVEKLCDEDVNIDDTHAELWKLLDQLGLSRDDQVNSGYDVLLRQKQGLEAYSEQGRSRGVMQ